MEYKGNIYACHQTSFTHLLNLIYPRVDAEWITARKDYLEEKKRRKAKHKKGSNVDTAAETYAQTSNELPGSSASDDNVYKEEMDEMRCILYAHGGLFLIRSTGMC